MPILYKGLGLHVVVNYFLEKILLIVRKGCEGGNVIAI